MKIAITSLGYFDTEIHKACNNFFPDWNEYAEFYNILRMRIFYEVETAFTKRTGPSDFYIALYGDFNE